nr:MAG TPA: hypothetical protein [Caudoviricetes sp.]
MQNFLHCIGHCANQCLKRLKNCPDKVYPAKYRIIKRTPVLCLFPE